MKRPVLILAAWLSAGAALAQPRPFSPAMPCGQTSELVQAYGAVVVQTTPTTYERYVSGSQHCVLGEIPEPAWVPSLDTPQCFVGYRCRDRYRFR